MFGFSVWKIIAATAAVFLLVGYFKYTQNKLEFLNKQIATKEFALQAANSTIEKQNKDILRQNEIASEAQKKYQDARTSLSDLESKFNKSDRDLDVEANKKSQLIEKKINAATKKAIQCIQDTINKGDQDEKC